MPMPTATVHLQPHADVAERILLPGDPGRALRLAQWLLDGPKMLNHHRGLWGYTGLAADGRPLTVQSTGLGGPGAAAIVEELVRLGARRVVRVGTARARERTTALGVLLVADPVLGADGASRALGAGPRQAPDTGLAAALEGAGDAHRAAVVSVDLFYGPAWEGPDGVAVDLESAAVLAAAARAGVPAACLLAVTGRIDDDERLGPDRLAAAEQELGRVGVAALR